MEIKPVYLDVRDIENLKEKCNDRDDVEIKLTGYIHYKATGKTLYGLTFIEYFPYSEEGAKNNV